MLLHLPLNRHPPGPSMPAAQPQHQHGTAGRIQLMHMKTLELEPKEVKSKLSYVSETAVWGHGMALL